MEADEEERKNADEEEDWTAAEADKGRAMDDEGSEEMRYLCCLACSGVVGAEEAIGADDGLELELELAVTSTAALCLAIMVCGCCCSGVSEIAVIGGALDCGSEKAHPIPHACTSLLVRSNDGQTEAESGASRTRGLQSELGCECREVMRCVSGGG